MKKNNVEKVISDNHQRLLRYEAEKTRLRRLGIPLTQAVLDFLIKKYRV